MDNTARVQAVSDSAGARVGASDRAPSEPSGFRVHRDTSSGHDLRGQTEFHLEFHIIVK
jgi:hypothetical protein